jgi:hypothetical protein
MSTYQKLQPTSARDIFPSDTINVPAPAVARLEGTAAATSGLSSLGVATAVQSGTQTAVTANKLVDVGANFTLPTPVVVGNMVVNTTTNAQAVVTAVDSSTVLTLNVNIFPNGGENYQIYQFGFLGVIKAGDVVVNTTAGTTSTVAAAVASTLLALTNNSLFISGGTFIVYAADTNELNSTQAACVVYIGDATGAAATWSEVKVMTADRSVVTFSHLPTGTFLPVQVLRVYATGTTATNMIALW